MKNNLLPKDAVCVSCIGSDLGKVVITTAPTVTNQQINSIIVDKSLFKAASYPAIANHVTDNMGNSSNKRYRAKELQFNGKDIYISTQFFESDREAVIEWYKRTR